MQAQCIRRENRGKLSKKQIHFRNHGMKALYFMKRLRRNLKQENDAELFPRNRDMRCCAVLPSCSQWKIEYSVLPVKDRIPHDESMIHRCDADRKEELRCFEVTAAG